MTMVLLLCAFVLLLLATFNVSARVNLIAAGLACWVLSQLLPVLGR